MICTWHYREVFRTVMNMSINETVSYSTVFPTSTWALTPTHIIISDVMVVMVILQALIGSIANGISLSYTIHRDRRTLASKLVIFLNSLDMMVCLSAFIAVVCSSYDVDIIALVSQEWFELLAEGTGFATTLISVTRTLLLVKPFYEVNDKLIALSAIIFMLYLAATKLMIETLTYVDSILSIIVMYLSLIGLSVMIVIVGICCVICVYYLYLADRSLNGKRVISRTNRHATITIIIIAILFCTVNLAYLILNFIWIRIVHNYFFKDASTYFLNKYVTLVGIPLNSALNPIIYITRKNDMRLFVQNTRVYKWLASKLYFRMGSSSERTTVILRTPVFNNHSVATAKL